MAPIAFRWARFSLLSCLPREKTTDTHYSPFLGSPEMSDKLRYEWHCWVDVRTNDGCNARTNDGGNARTNDGCNGRTYERRRQRTYERRVQRTYERRRQRTYERRVQWPHVRTTEATHVRTTAAASLFKLFCWTIVYGT